MKILKQLLVFILVINGFNSCTEEEVSYVFQDISAPTELKADFDIAQDDSGQVSVTPTAVGATAFEIYFGDEVDETPQEAAPGETVTHIYDEGEFNLRVVAIGLTGLTSELNRVVTISFSAPTDLELTIAQTNPLEITVTPSATNATVYDVYFGEDPEEEPVTIMDGESAVYVYSAAGEFTIRVVARGAGAATTEVSETISVEDLTNAEAFPIDFESNETLTGVFEDSQGVTGTPIPNPDASGINTSATVFEFNKAEGAAWYSGLFHIFSEDMDLSASQLFSIKIWSPKAGINVRFQLEKEGGNGTPPTYQIDQTLETANEWVTLTYDFSGVINPSDGYDKLVIFPDFDDVNQPAADGSVYYIDDITLEEATGEAPQLPIDFQSSTIDYNISGFGAADFGPIPAQIIDNPDASGINNSTKVLEIDKLEGAQTYAGGVIPLDGAIDWSEGTTISVKVWSPRAGTPIRLKIEDSSSPADGNGNPTVFAEVEVNSSTAGAWEELLFDMTNPNAGAFDPGIFFDRLILFPDFGTAGQGESFYFDDIAVTGSGGGGPAKPASAAPDPTEAQANVINMYSNSYTQDVEVSSWRSDWSTGTLTDIKIQGNDTKEYKGADFVGVEFYGSPVDATDMDFFHVDVWAPEQTVFSVRLVDLGSGNAEGNVETNIPTGQWVSLDIPMSDFIAAGLSARSSIQQILFDGTSGVPDNFDFYIDNVYFYKVPPTSPSAPAPDPTEAQADVINMYSNAYTQDVDVSSWRSDWSTGTLTDIQIEGNDTKEYKGADFVGVEFYGTPVDATDMGFLHVDVWSAEQTVFSIRLVDLGSGNVEGNVASDIPTGQWVSLDIPMSEFIAAGLTTQNLYSANVV